MDQILSISERRRYLVALFRRIREGEMEIASALRTDLGKPEFEAFATEILPVESALRLLIRNLKKWASPRRVSCAFYNFPSSGKLVPEPFGRVLIFSAWNYPFSLMLEPFSGAFAAGNHIVLKPSESAPATEKLLGSLISEIFPEELVQIKYGDASTAQKLLEEPFDYIFYTGGPTGGKAVARAAAEHLTPVTLELGGKSPCIVDSDADLESALRRIVWGKFLNAGQTCVAPDYLLVHKCLRPDFIKNLRFFISCFYGKNPRFSPDYGRIVTTRHFDRLTALAKAAGLTLEGDRETLFIAPSLIEEPPLDSDLMREEIFGPILPVLYFEKIADAVRFVTERPKPLALYYFGKKNAKKIIRSTSSGSVCINDCVMQTVNPAMPFGGVGASGLGAYHGRSTFDTFTHWKSVMRKHAFPELPVRYPPFSDAKLKVLKTLMK